MNLINRLPGAAFKLMKSIPETVYYNDGSGETAITAVVNRGRVKWRELKASSTQGSEISIYVSKDDVPTVTTKEHSVRLKPDIAKTQYREYRVWEILEQEPNAYLLAVK